MARAGRKQFGAGSLGKSDGSGAKSDMSRQDLPENGVLSNRDKSRHSGARGLDGKAVQSEQLRDHAANRLEADERL